MFKRPNNPPAPDNAAARRSGPPDAAPAAKQVPSRPAPPGKQAYEARRAAKAGVSLERWMADKQKQAQAELEAARRARTKSEPVKPGFLKRLLDRAHKPL